MEEKLSIETPEHIQVHYELAGLGSRMLAGLYDALWQGLILFIIVAPLMWLAAWLNLSDLFGLAGAIIIAALGFLFTTGYYVYCEMTMNGQSPGKRQAGLRVVRTDGTPITFLDSAIRNIIRAVDMIPFFYSVGMLAMFFSPRMQRLGDMAAGTVVIKERLYDRPEGTIEAPVEGPDPLLQLPPEVQTRLRGALPSLGPVDFQAAERFLERRFELEPAVRADLLQRVALPLLAKMPQVTSADFPDLELFLEALVRLRGQQGL
jgi:uncharacterized RDD family membrane protein YckC